MLFRELSKLQLIGKINELNVHCKDMFGTAFCEAKPSSPEQFSLKHKFNKTFGGQGLYSMYYDRVLEDSNIVDKARQHLFDANYSGDYYKVPDASLKCHISLNNIGNIDEDIIYGLVTLLKDEAESVNNNLSFHFKVVDPNLHNDHRFKDNDQFTIYFDKYTSLGDVLDLAHKVDEYLQKYLPQNINRLGNKDNCDINSFVSARIDTNRLLNRYDVFPFFDLEIKKLLAKYSSDELREVPLCSIEAIFNYVITADDITIPVRGSKKDLSEEDSIKVQSQFELMIANPSRYLKENPIEISLHTQKIDSTEEIWSPSHKQASGFDFDMQTLGLFMEILGGLTVAVGISALILSTSFGSPLMIVSAVTAGLGIACFAGGFFTGKSEPKDTVIDNKSLLTTFER